MEAAAEDLSRMVERAMNKQGLSARRVAGKIGELPSGRIIDTTQISRIIDGRRRDFSAELVDALVEALELNRNQAYRAAGLWPPDVEVEDVELLQQLRALDDDAAIGAVQRHRKNKKRHASARRGEIQPPNVSEQPPEQGKQQIVYIVEFAGRGRRRRRVPAQPLPRLAPRAA